MFVYSWSKNVFAPRHVEPMNVNFGTRADRTLAAQCQISTLSVPKCGATAPKRQNLELCSCICLDGGITCTILTKFSAFTRVYSAFITSANKAGLCDPSLCLTVCHSSMITEKVMGRFH